MVIDMRVESSLLLSIQEDESDLCIYNTTLAVVQIKESFSSSSSLWSLFEGLDPNDEKKYHEK